MKDLRRWALGLLTMLTIAGLVALPARTVAQDTAMPATLDSAGLTLEELN